MVLVQVLFSLKPFVADLPALPASKAGSVVAALRESAAAKAAADQCVCLSILLQQCDASLEQIEP